MEVVFRKLPSAETLAVQPGEVYLVPAAADQRGRRDLARFVLEHGAEGLLRGPGMPRCLVLDVEPRLDDMLAAALAQRKLEDQPVPAGCEAFARYTALLREGLRPSTFPLEYSLEGIFLAIRGNAEKSLTDPEMARQFLADWKRLADAILQAAEAGEDPFTTPLLGSDAVGGSTYALRSINRGTSAGRSQASFARELVFLAKDFGVYCQDFAQGEVWQVRLPGTRSPAQGLLLRSPKSLLFKYWTRSPCPPPQGGPFPFLAVTWGKGRWVFTTSAAEPLSLQPLAKLLQAAERKQTPTRAEKHTWSDGEPPHMLVSAPHGGSQLPEPLVLNLVRKWCRVRTANPGRKLRWAAVALACCLAATGALVWFLGRPTAAQKNHQLAKIYDVHVLAVGVSRYQNLANELPSAAKDAEALTAAFKQLEGHLYKKVATRVLKDQEATRADIINYGLSRWLLEQQEPPLTRHSLVIATFSGHGFVEGGTNRYLFAPYDYDPMNQGTTGIFLTDLQRYLGILPCPVIVIFDTCHSGAVNGDDESDPNDPRNLSKFQQSVNEFSGHQGLVVIAACAGYQKANETERWGHGALTLALLEGLEGHYLYTAKDRPSTPLPTPGSTHLVTLYDLDRYVTDRVEVLSSEISSPKYRRQAARTYCTSNISLEQIPIAVYKGR